MLNYLKIFPHLITASQINFCLHEFIQFYFYHISTTLLCLIIVYNCSYKWHWGCLVFIAVQNERSVFLPPFKLAADDFVASYRLKLCRRESEIYSR